MRGCINCYEQSAVVERAVAQRILADMTDARDHGVRLVELGQMTMQTVLTAQAETVASEVAKTTAATVTTLRAAA